MKKVLKVVGIILLVLVVLIIGTIFYLRYHITHIKDSHDLQAQVDAIDDNYSALVTPRMMFVNIENHLIVQLNWIAYELTYFRYDEPIDLSQNAQYLYMFECFAFFFALFYICLFERREREKKCKIRIDDGWVTMSCW